MSRKLFVNLAVKDLKRSVDFFTQLGFQFDPRFTDESATCMIVNDAAYVMLLVTDRFKGFIKKAVCDSATHTEAILAYLVESREAVNETVKKAIESGGSRANDPTDHGFMYLSSFYDPDGHLFEVFWMNPEAMAKGS